MTYTAENMSGMLGSECTDNDAQIFAAHLLANGWELEENEAGLIVAFRDDEYMTEEEWHEALASCPWEN